MATTSEIENEIINALKASKQYMASLQKNNTNHNSIAIIKRAIKEKWSPNEIAEPKKVITEQELVQDLLKELEQSPLDTFEKEVRKELINFFYKKSLSLSLNIYTYNAWIKSFFIEYTTDKKIITLFNDNDFTVEYVNNNYKKQLQSALKELGVEKINIEFKN